MKFFAGFMLASAIFLLIIIFSNLEITHYRVYDCGMAEWHPDIPNAVREECRRRSLEEWKNVQSKKTI